MNKHLTLLILIIAALAFVAMQFISEYAFLCRMVLLCCVCVIAAVKLYKTNDLE